MVAEVIDLVEKRLDVVEKRVTAIEQRGLRIEVLLWVAVGLGALDRVRPFLGG